MAVSLCFYQLPVFAASATDEAVLGNDRWSVTNEGDLLPNANTYSIGSVTQYPASIWVGGAEYTSFAAGTDGNWTGGGLTTTLDAAPTKFIATHSSGDFFATGFTAGTGDITLENGQKIDGGTNNAIKLIENSDTVTLTFTGNDFSIDNSDGGIIFSLTDATDGTVDFMTNNDQDDYIQISTTTNQPLINFVGCNGKITAASGTIDFDNENLTTTGTLSSGATTVTSLIIGDETFSVPTDDTIRVASNDAQTIFQVYTAATSDEDAVLLLSADASADNGDDWQIVSDGDTNSLLLQNDALGTQDTYLTLSNVGDLTLAGDIITLGDGETITNAVDDTVSITSNDADMILRVYSPKTSDGDATLSLVGDAGADAKDRWDIVNDTGDHKLYIKADASVANTMVTQLTIDSADGDITTIGDIEIADDMDLVFGSNADWKVQYDEGVDDQLLFITANTAAGATTDPMFEILVGTTPTADQQVFGVGKGTQASNTALFTVDEDGDVEIAGTTTAAGAISMGYEMVTTSSDNPGVGVASVSKLFTAITSITDGDAADTVSLAAGMAGQMKIITLAVDGETSGTSVTADYAGASTAVLLEDAGDMLILCSDGTEWYIVYNNGGTVS